jgi:hypothetical protein
LTYLIDDENTRARIKGSIAISVSTAIFVFGLTIMLSFIEDQLPKMFGLPDYNTFISSINDEISQTNDKIDPIIENYVNQLQGAYVIGQSSTSYYGVTTSIKGCDTGIDTEKCIGNQQKKIAEYTTMINIAMDTQIALILGKTIFDFFITKAAGFLLGAGLAYYTFDPTRSAGAAMIAVGLAAYYVYPVAYQAFFNLPQPPELTGASSTMKDIASNMFCNINTFPSTYITKSDYSLSLIATQHSQASPPSISLESGSIISFLNSLYTSFLMKHAAALAVSLIFIQNAFVILSSGLTAAPLVSRIGRFL